MADSVLRNKSKNFIKKEKCVIPTEEKDYISSLIKQSETGDILAMEKVATYYSQNHPELMNDATIKLVLEYYEKAVSVNHQRAQLNLGAIYYNGVYVKQDYTKAIELYKLALCGDDVYIAAIAASNLGYCYYYGRNVDIDYSKAFDYFLEGVLLCNHPVCLYKLGDMYRYGKFVNKDNEKAYLLYCKAKHKSPSFDYNGYSDILVRLAESKLEGIGTEKDIICALKYARGAVKMEKESAASAQTIEKAYSLIFKATELCAQGIQKPSYTLKFTCYHIEVLSRFRIPFDNTTSREIENFKDDLQFALQTLASSLAIRTSATGEKCILSARYGTTNTKKQFYDLENVLFYNVGTATFSNVAKNGVAFAEVSQHDICAKQSEWGLSNEYEHYYEYELCSPQETVNTNIEIASWHDIPFCKCKSLTPFDAWSAMHNAERNIQVKGRIECEFGDAFSLELKLEKPKALEFNVISAMKPLLDGIISSLHGGRFDENFVSLLAEKLSCSHDKIINVGMDVLGKRDYIKTYSRAANGIKWNPADDVCKFVSIQIVDGEEWRLSGRVCKVLPRCPKCNKTNMARILYGMPEMDEELKKQLDEGSVVIAGCCIDDKMPRYRCRWCKTEF